MEEMSTCSDGLFFKCLLCVKASRSLIRLPCCHVFCTSCLDIYIRSEHVIADNVPCPVCESPCYSHDKELTTSSLDASFPLYPMLTFSTDNGAGSGETFCYGCLTDNEESIASFWCKFCMKALCKLCRVAHTRSKLLSQHNVVALNVSEKEERMPLATVDCCPQHIKETIEAYCIDHSTLCCKMCLSLSHISCKQMMRLDDAVMKIKPRQTEFALDNIKDEIKKIIEEDNTKVKTIDTDHLTLKNKMAATIQKAKDRLDELHVRFQKSLDQTHKRERDSLACLIRTNKLLREREGTRNPCIISEEPNIQRLSKSQGLQKISTDKHKTSTINLRFDDTLLKINSMTAVGKLEVSSSLSSTSSDALTAIEAIIDEMQTTPSSFSFVSSQQKMMSDEEQMNTQRSSETQRVDVWTGTLSLVKSVKRGSLGGSHRPWLTGGVFIDGEGLMFTDFYNMRLMLFDDQYNFIRHYDVDSSPIDVTHWFTAAEMLVSLYNGMLMRYSLQDGKLTEVDWINPPSGTVGVAVLGTNILVGTPDAVQIIRTNGTQVKTVHKRGINTYIAASPQEHFYHKDGNVIVCRSHDGEEIFRRTCQGMREPRGIGVDRDNNVYVCGQVSADIRLISPDGSRDRVLLSKLSGINVPYAIVVHPTRQEIVVTSFEEDVVFEVYKFCKEKGTVK